MRAHLREGSVSQIDVALVGGSALHREGLRQLLDASHFSVVADGRDFSSVLTLIDNGACPRLVIADLTRLPEAELEGLRRVRDAAPDCRILVLSSNLDVTSLARAFRAGADGY